MAHSSALDKAADEYNSVTWENVQLRVEAKELRVKNKLLEDKANMTTKMAEENLRLQCVIARLVASPPVTQGDELRLYFMPTLATIVESYLGDCESDSLNVDIPHDMRNKGVEATAIFTEDDCEYFVDVHVRVPLNGVCTSIPMCEYPQHECPDGRYCPSLSNCGEEWNGCPNEETWGGTVEYNENREFTFTLVCLRPACEKHTFN